MSYTIDTDGRTPDELREMARSARTWVEPHDCDDIPCPTYGDDCMWMIAGELDLLAEEREAAGQ